MMKVMFSMNVAFMATVIATGIHMLVPMVMETVFLDDGDNCIGDGDGKVLPLCTAKSCRRQAV
jgi:hypothetical protein